MNAFRSWLNLLFEESQTGNLKNLAVIVAELIDWLLPTPEICGQSYKASTIVIYASRVVPDLKIPHITTLES